MPEDQDSSQTPPESAGAPDAATDPALSAEAMAADALDAAEKAVGELSAAPAAESPASAAAPATDAATAFNFEPLNPTSASADAPEGISLLADVNLNVKIELGRTRMVVEDVLKLTEGCVVELDKLAGDPVDVYVNDRHVARGEVLVLNDNFCVRISEIINPVTVDKATIAA